MIKRGLYRDLNVCFGTPLEAALIFHEQRESSRNLLSTIIGAFGVKMKDAGKAIDQLEEMYYPGVQTRRKKQQDRDVKLIRAAHDYDWSKVFMISPEQERISEERKLLRSDPVLSKYAK